MSGDGVRLGGDISEIAGMAGLFLSGVREAAGGGRAKPVRVPPGGVRVEDMGSGGEAGADVVGRGRAGGAADVARVAVGRRVWAVVGGHLGGGARGALRRVVAEAGRVMAGEAGGGDGRVGVLELEGETTKLGMVDAGLPVDAAGAVEGTDAREMAGAVAELSGEVEGWVFGTEDLRRDGEWVDAAAGEGGAWIVPVEGGEDARVEAYRVIKALGSRGMRGRLVLAAVGEGAVEVAGKLREVIRKFLAWDAADMFVVGVEGEGFVHGLMSAGGGEGTWAGALGAMVGAEEVSAVETDPARTVVEAGVGVVREQKGTEPAPEPVRMAIVPVIGELGRDEVEVLEFVGEGAEGVLDSVMAGGEWVGCGLELPGSGRARLAVDGGGRLVVLGVLEDGGDVAELGRAWRWVAENAAVVARAVRPVVADGGKAPEMVVFAGSERAGDLAAVVGAGVRVRTYRALRWGGRRGLLVEAA